MLWAGQPELKPCVLLLRHCTKRDPVDIASYEHRSGGKLCDRFVCETLQKAGRRVRPCKSGTSIRSTCAVGTRKVGTSVAVCR